MTQEEKAKAYDEALKVLHKYDGVNIMFSQSLKEEMFPELKVSEDEKIRKALIEACKQSLIVGGFHKDKVIAWLEKQGEQKPVIIPKFRVGDWIVNNEYGHVIKVLDINKEQYTYRLDYGDTCGTIIISLIDNDYHLWTIQDAKDGDVLMANAPFIFNGNLEVGIGCPGAHCGINTLGEFQIPEYPGHWTDHTTTPATKEQRDLLFQKMKEAGYVWDDEKKELRKIEQNPAWSEEDEQYKSGLIGLVENSRAGLPINLRGKAADKCIYWLKSLKDRYTWKPSEEQMNTLEYYMHTLVCNEHKEVLFGLYSDLKKLREE